MAISSNLLRSTRKSAQTHMISCSTELHDISASCGGSSRSAKSILPRAHRARFRTALGVRTSTL
jgi:hypothetical protein